jgi:hypothetical protein
MCAVAGDGRVAPVCGGDKCVSLKRARQKFQFVYERDFNTNVMITKKVLQPGLCSSFVRINFCFLKRLFYTKKQWKKVNKDCTKLETMKKIKNRKKINNFFTVFLSVARPHLGKPKSLLICASRKQSGEVSSSGGSSPSIADKRQPN